MIFKSIDKKFEIGDIITGVEGSLYTVTNSCGKYEVIRVYDDEFIRVKVLEHINPFEVGNGYDVLSKHFVYAEGFAHWKGIFNRAYNQKTFDIENGVPVVEGVSVDSPCYKQLCDEYEEYVKSMEKER